jgi:hypothetical protein
MPQQFAQVSYEPLMAAGRAFGQIPGQLADVAVQYGKMAKLKEQNENIYSQMTSFLDRTGIPYDKKALKPQSGEEGYEARAKQAAAPILGALENRGVDVQALIKTVSTPGFMWEQVDSILKGQQQQQQQQDIARAVTAAREPSPPMNEEQLRAAGGMKLPPAEYAAQLDEPATKARVFFTRPAPQTESEFYGRFAEETARLPPKTAVEIPKSPVFAVAQKEFAAKTAEGKAAAIQEEKSQKRRLAMAMDIWDKVKAGNKVFKDGTIVDKPSFYDILENVEQYALEPGAPPRAGGRGADRDKLPASLDQANKAEMQLNQLRSGRDMFGNKIAYNEDEYRAKQNEVAMWKLAGDLEVRDKTFDEAYTMASRAINVNMVIDEAKQNEPVIYDEAGKVKGLNWANPRVRQGLVAAVLAGGTAADVLSTMRKLRGINPPRLIEPETQTMK